MHLKRNEMPNTWPIAKKGTKYLLVANHSKTRAIPILMILRDMLKFAKTRSEVKFMIYNKEIKLNNKVVKEEKMPMEISDILTIEKMGKNWRLKIENKKFKLEEVSGSEKDIKISKIIGKKVLGKNEIQINLSDGRNYLVKENFSVGDSAVVNLKENKIEKILKLKDGAKIEVISGKHLGQIGNIKEIRQVGKQKIFVVKIGGKELNLPSKTAKVIG